MSNCNMLCSISHLMFLIACVRPRVLAVIQCHQWYHLTPWHSCPAVFRVPPVMPPHSVAPLCSECHQWCHLTPWHNCRCGQSATSDATLLRGTAAPACSECHQRCHLTPWHSCRCGQSATSDATLLRGTAAPLCSESSLSLSLRGVLPSVKGGGVTTHQLGLSLTQLFVAGCDRLQQGTAHWDTSV